MPRKREFDREKVLVEAMMLFRDQGYRATSVQNLVERMGINRFSLYSTFKSKRQLFVATLDAYYEQVAIPFFGRMSTSGKGLEIIEAVLLDLVTRIKEGVSPNGCLICNSIAELGAGAGRREVRLFQKYLKRIEGDFHAAIARAKQLGEVPEDVDASGHAKRLVTYSTGILMLGKVMTEQELRESVRSAVSAIN
ncbi:MAG: TetR/AcrR family transcriptional regulator [Planctomycetota bacterium]|jgi:TetR/AcrR family transcriptional repressor of nem operon